MEIVLNDKMSYSQKRLIFIQMNDKPTIMLSVEIAPNARDPVLMPGIIMALDAQDLLDVAEFCYKLLKKQEDGRLNQSKE